VPEGGLTGEGGHGGAKVGMCTPCNPSEKWTTPLLGAPPEKELYSRKRLFAARRIPVSLAFTVVYETFGTLSAAPRTTRFLGCPRAVSPGGAHSRPASTRGRRRRPRLVEGSFGYGQRAIWTWHE